MKILMVQTPRVCTRNFKFSRLLKLQGHEVISIQVDRTIPEFVGNAYTGFYNMSRLIPQTQQLLVDEKKLLTNIKEIKPDVIHIHNEPDYFVLVVKKHFPEIPVIHNIHDFNSCYHTTDPSAVVTIEQMAFEAADGLIHVSDTAKDICLQKYPHLKDKLHLVMPSYVLREQIPDEKDFLPRLSPKGDVIHIGYQGGVAEGSPHRDYFPQWDYVTQRFKYHIHMHPFNITKMARQRAQQSPFYHWYPPLPAVDLFKHMTQYNFGWLGYTEKALLLDLAMPNKLFEYAALGLPIISSRYAEIAAFIEKHKLGFVWDSLDEIPAKVEEWKDYREQKIFALDDHAKEIEKYHEKVIEKAGRS